MKLLMATDHYLPHPGGASRVILETSRRLQAREHTVTILTFERDLALPRRDLVAGVQVHRIPLQGRLTVYPRALFCGRQAIQQQLRESKPDLLHMHLPLIGLGILLNPEISQSPRVYTFHGPWHQEMELELRAKPLRPPWHGLYGLYVGLLCRVLWRWQDQVMRRCDRVTVLSEHFRRQLALLFPAITQDRVELVPGGVDIERFSPSPNRAAVRVRLGLPTDKIVLLTLRRLVPRMGLENLLHAFAQVSTECDDLYLVVGGSGPLEHALRALAGQLGMSNRVLFAGYIPEDALPAYYQATDLFVLPTLALEGFGLPILEALASGLPVVGTPVGGTAELLGQFDPRFLTSGTDARALTEGIRRCLTLSQQEGEALIARCRAFATQYSWEQIVDQYEDLYAQIATCQTG